MKHTEPKYELIVVHLQNQLDSVNYWRVVVPELSDIKNKILTECHPVPYSAHPGVQRTLNNVRQSFYWRDRLDKATRMTHLIACRKSVTATQSARLYMRGGTKLHGIPSLLYSEKGTQFTSKFWKELCGLFGMQLKFSTVYQSQTQCIVERMNAVVGQFLRCTFAQMNDIKKLV